MAEIQVQIVLFPNTDNTQDKNSTLPDKLLVVERSGRVSPHNIDSALEQIDIDDTLHPLLTFIYTVASEDAFGAIPES